MPLPFDITSYEVPITDTIDIYGDVVGDFFSDIGKVASQAGKALEPVAAAATPAIAKAATPQNLNTAASIAKDVPWWALILGDDKSIKHDDKHDYKENHMHSGVPSSVLDITEELVKPRTHIIDPEDTTMVFENSVQDLSPEQASRPYTEIGMDSPLSDQNIRREVVGNTSIGRVSYDQSINREILNGDSIGYGAEYTEIVDGVNGLGWGTSYTSIVDGVGSSEDPNCLSVTCPKCAVPLKLCLTATGHGTMSHTVHGAVECVGAFFSAKPPVPVKPQTPSAAGGMYQLECPNCQAKMTVNLSGSVPTHVLGAPPILWTSIIDGEIRGTDVLGAPMLNAAQLAAKKAQDTAANNALASKQKQAQALRAQNASKAEKLLTQAAQTFKRKPPKTHAGAIKAAAATAAIAQHVAQKIDTHLKQTKILGDILGATTTAKSTAQAAALKTAGQKLQDHAVHLVRTVIPAHKTAIKNMNTKAIQAQASKNMIKQYTIKKK